MISEIENATHNIAKAFYNAGLRKGQTVEFVIPNSTNYHVIIFGVWLCEGIASLADPGLSLKVLKAHLQDTKASFVMCYEGSRKTGNIKIFFSQNKITNYKPKCSSLSSIT